MQRSSEDLECRVCLEIMRPPILMCLCRYSICNNCWDRVTVCPFCRREKSEYEHRDYDLEIFHNVSLFPCKYNSAGCTVNTLWANLEEHENFCNYAIISCTLKDVNNCSWMGQRGCMVEHARDCHPEIFFGTTEETLTFPEFLTCKNCADCNKPIGYHVLFHVFGELFKVFWGIHPQEGIMKCCVIFMGPRKEAEKYNFQMDLESKHLQYIQIECQSSEKREIEYTIVSIEELKRLSTCADLNFSVVIRKTDEEPPEELPLSNLCDAASSSN